MAKAFSLTVPHLPGWWHWVGSYGAAFAGGRQSETHPSTNERSGTGCGRSINCLQTGMFWSVPCTDERLPLTPGLCPSWRFGAKKSFHPPEASRLHRSPIACTVGALEPRQSDEAIIGDDEESRNYTPLQTFSGRLARTTFERVPEASNGLVPLQLGGTGSERLNQSSACQSREQRNTGPRTPLHVNEGRPRARYDKKERSKCSQVEYDSC
jgi:hypothetical protein